MTRRGWALLGLVVVCTALSTLPWWRGYGLHLALPGLLGAAVLAPVVPLVSAAVTTRRSPAAAVGVVAADVLAAVVFGLVVLTRGDVVLLARGLWRGPVTLLSYSLPLVEGGWLLAVPVALTWLTGAVAGHALVGGRGLGAVVPWWVGAFVVADAGTRRAVAASAGGWWTASWVAPAALLTAVLLLLAVAAAGHDRDVVVDPSAVSDPGRPGGPRLRIRAVVGVVALVAAALGGTVVGVGSRPDEVLPDRRPGSAKAQLVTALTYVVQLRSGARRDAAVLDVETDRPWSGYLALAELDRYDGDSWTFTRRFQPSGGLVPADPDPSLAGAAPVRQRYRIRSGLVGSPWLPHLSTPKRVVGMPIDVDPVAGLPVPARDLAADDRFEVVSAADATALPDLPGESAFSLSRPPTETQVPTELMPLLGRLLPAEDDAHLPMERLQTLLTSLHEEYRLVPGAAAAAGPQPTAAPSPRSAATDRTGGGTAFSDVTASILGPTRSGTPEQFATLFAVAARSLGVPARVVSGFRVPPGDAGGPVPAGARTVTAAQAWTWVELPVQGRGWVVADPSPTRTGEVAAAPTLGARPTKASPTRPAQELLVPSAGGHAVAEPEPAPGPAARSSHLAVIWWLLAAVPLGAAIVLVLLALRRRRHRTIGRRDRHDQVAAEWRAALLQLADCGVSGLDPLTAREVAAVAHERFGDDAGRATVVLAELSDRALFSPSRSVRSSDVAAARAARRELSRAARAQLRPTGRAARVMRQGRRLVSSSWRP